jgi:hypothetical protein
MKPENIDLQALFGGFIIAHLSIIIPILLIL